MKTAILFGILCFSIPVTADDRWPDPEVTDPVLQQKAEKLASGFQGAFLVAKGGRVLATQGLGLANRTSGEKNMIRTSFRLASISKPLTAVAVMQLVEQGKLQVDDTVSDHIKDYGPNGSRLKIRHLLSHSSGIPDYIGGVHNPSGPGEIVDWFKGKPLAFTPGSQFSYSNSNFTLLGYILEKVTGRSYEAYMQTNVWQPARMDYSGFHFPKNPGPGFAAPSGGNPNGPWESNLKAYSAGALYASVTDMLNFNHALYNGILLRPETVKLMHQKHAGSYGFGFFVGNGSVSHDGSISGFTSQLYSYPSEQGIIIVLSNGSKGASGLASSLKSILSEREG